MEKRRARYSLGSLPPPLGSGAPGSAGREQLHRAGSPVWRDTLPLAQRRYQWALCNPPAPILSPIMAVLSENNHSIIIKANVRSGRIGKNCNVLKLFRSVLEMLRGDIRALVAGEKQLREKAFRRPDTRAFMFFFFFQWHWGKKTEPREEHNHTDTQARRAPRARGIFVLEMLQRKEEAAANDSRIFAHLSCFYYQGRSI